jgi:hypothetical protein
MVRCWYKLALVSAALAAGCSRHPKTEAVAPAHDASAGETPPIGDGRPARVAETPAVFSLPIAATRAGRTTFVAGFVAGENVVRVMALRGANVLWTMDPVRAVTWTPDAELRLEPAADGVAVLWRSAHGESSAGSVVVMDEHGQAKGGPDGVGASMCTTATGLAWIAADRHGPSRVFARAWDEGAGHAVGAIPPDRAPSLYCGARGVFVLADGDDDITATSFVPGDATMGASAVVLRDADFADDERDHYAFSVGDDLGIMRVGDSGDVSLRRVPRGGNPAPWRKWKHAIGSDDDIVDVDGDVESTIAVVEAQAGGVCPSTGAPADRLRAVRFDSSEHESVIDLSAPDCDRTPGPVWIAEAPRSGLLVAWGQSAARPKSAAAPLSGLGFRSAGPGHSGDMAFDAVGLTKAGCDDEGCFAAALEIENDGDAMHPLKIGLYQYVSSQ